MIYSINNLHCEDHYNQLELHRTAQPHTLAIFRSWGSSVGAGRIRLAGCKYKERKVIFGKRKNKIF